MKNGRLLLLIIFSYTLCFAQAKEPVKKRFHKNKRISTIETWDKEKRNGCFVCMNSRGDTLVQFYLRRFGGHASAWAEYYPNGQVRKLELSDAPDAGIQCYREILYYNVSSGS